MDEKDDVVKGLLLLAVVGGTVAALFYTKRGREAIRRIEGAMDDFGGTLQHLRGTLEKAAKVAVEGMDVATEGLSALSQLSATLGNRQPQGPRPVQARQAER